MRKKRYSVIVSVVIISVFLCSGSFAQPDPDADILPHSDLIFQEDMRNQTVACFEWLIDKLRNEVKPTLALSDQDRLELLITMIDARRARLNPDGSIDLYFSNSSQNFATLKAHYDLALPQPMEDLISKADQISQDKKNQTLNQSLLMALNMIPTTILSQASKTTLENFIITGTSQAAAGSRGKSRITICEPYIKVTNFNPNPLLQDPLEIVIEPELAVIIATDD